MSQLVSVGLTYSIPFRPLDVLFLLMQFKGRASESLFSHLSKVVGAGRPSHGPDNGRSRPPSGFEDQELPGSLDLSSLTTSPWQHAYRGLLQLAIGIPTSRSCLENRGTYLSSIPLRLANTKSSFNPPDCLNCCDEIDLNYMQEDKRRWTRCAQGVNRRSPSKRSSTVREPSRLV